MNLNYGYDKEALEALIATADVNKYEHNLVIDFDGEVIIDPEYYFPAVPLDKYQYSMVIMDSSLRQHGMTGALYDALERIYVSLNVKSIKVNFGRSHVSKAA